MRLDRDRRGAELDESFFACRGEGQTASGALLAGRTRLMVPDADLTLTLSLTPNPKPNPTPNQVPDAEAERIAGIEVGGECWASALSGAGFKARYRVRFLGIQQNGPPCIVRFLADSSGRSTPLCLPSPLVQFLDLSELSRLDEYSTLPPSPEAAAGAGGDASAAPAAAGSGGAAGPLGAVGGRRSKRPRAPSEGAVRAAATEPLRKPAAVRGGKRRLEAEEAEEAEAEEEEEEEGEEDEDEACARCLSTASAAGNEMLLCDGAGCPVGFHLRCLCPALPCVPEH